MTLSKNEQKYFFLNMIRREMVEEELMEKTILKKEAVKKCF